MDTKDTWKNEFTNALIYCEHKLENENLICSIEEVPPEVPLEEISPVSTAIGEEIYKQLSYMLADRKIIRDEELVAFNEINNEDENEYKECTEEHNEKCNEKIDDYIPEEEEHTFEYIPLSYKEKAVALAKAHPKWSLRSLQHNGCNRLKNMSILRRWKEDVKRGGTRLDKLKQIESEIFERFLEARESLEQVTTKTLQLWAMSTALPFLSEEFKFSATRKWVNKFKQKHKIKQRSITRYVSSKDYATLEEITETAERFKNQTRVLMHDFKLDFIINTNQIRCQYRMTYNKSLTEPWAKTNHILKEDLDTLTCSYTAQYTLTASGKIIPYVFLCMQEPTGKFTSLIQTNINKLINDFKNVIVTCSKSGKLTKELYKEFLKRTLSPYVSKNKFLLIIDSSKNETDPTLYDDIFEDETGRTIYTIKVIPTKCTPICDPSEVYFHRQVKYFIKQLQNASALLKPKREIVTRENVIKMHSLLLHQFSAPIFIPMIQYTWFASKLISYKPIFLNVNEVCFPLMLQALCCLCKKVSVFIRCAWCELTLCFICFYDNYHPNTCKGSPYKQNFESD